MAWEQVVSVIALVIALLAVVVGLVVLRRLEQSQHRVPGLVSQPRVDATQAPPGPPAIVINPSKVQRPDEIRALARRLASELAMQEPLWFETTPEDPGHGQAEAAVAQGASVVVAAGGDGTVRAVASALAGTGTPMALLPLGTGNLLARNLDLPSEGTQEMLMTAFTGAEHPIDLGWIRPVQLETEEAEADEHRGPEVLASGSTSGADHPSQGTSERDGSAGAEHVFLVAAGMGFDAAMVGGADDVLKARMGWFAYFIAGARHLHDRKVKVRLQIGDGEVRPLKLRSLLVANCGRLPGGLVLLPNAELNDGWLDVAAIDTRGGVIGWASLLSKVVLQGLGVRRQIPGQPGKIDVWRGQTIRVWSEHTEPVQVDGDIIGETAQMHVRVQPGGLVVRTR